MTSGSPKISTDTAHVSGRATLAGATLGGVAGTVLGSNTGVALAAHLGLCAVGSAASCGLLFPLLGTIAGGVAAKEWIEGRIKARDRAMKTIRRKIKRTQANKKSLFSFTR